jgi:manganese efflux pump family protein
METIIIFIVALGLAMDCFSLSIVNSSLSGQVKPGIPLQASILFALGHFLFLMLGSWLSGFLENMFAGREAWAAFVVFTVVGVKMIREAVRRSPGAKVFDINNMSVILVMALAASMDALLVGIAFGLVNARIFLAAGLVAFASFLFTLSGLAGGQHFGLAFAKKTSIFGGVFMFIVALHYLFSVFV